MPAAINQSSDENAQMPSNEQEQEASNGAEPKMAESELKTDVTSEKYGIDDLFSWFSFYTIKFYFLTHIVCLVISYPELFITWNLHKLIICFQFLSK